MTVFIVNQCRVRTEVVMRVMERLGRFGGRRTIGSGDTETLEVCWIAKRFWVLEFRKV